MIKVKAVNQTPHVKAYFTDSVKVLIQIPVDQKEDLIEKLSQVNALLDLKDADAKVHIKYIQR